MKFRIRSKLAAALALPLAALLAVAGYEVADAGASADSVRDQTELAVLALGPRSATAALQQERAFVSVDLVGLADVAGMADADFEGSVGAVDDSVEALRADLGSRSRVVQDAFAPAISALSDLDDLRQRYQAYSGPKDLGNFQLASDLFDGYGRVVDAFFAATSTLAASVDEAELRNGVEIVDAANRRSEALAATTSVLALDVLSGTPTARGRALVGAGAAQIRQLDDRIAQLAVGPYRDVTAELETDVTELFDDFAAGAPVDLAEVLGAGGLGESTIRDEATGVLLGQVDRFADDAWQQQRLVVFGAAAVLILAIVITFFATVSITRPLRDLRTQAEDMAERRLPRAVEGVLSTPMGADVTLPYVEPVSVSTRDEVGEVAVALNKVQTRTLGLAVDQAVLRHNIADSFVNLGRRNQSLLDRQLRFITELEQNETDPESLDALFRLDHLATRMRRNAESLLVLAGSETPRTWGAPVGIGDVVRAGLGEVEAYQRVNVRHLDPAEISGGAVAGLAHIVAELVENALTFSPPGESVEVKGRWAADTYVVAIADNGIGMSADDLEDANRRLAGREAYTVAPSKYLGHYVTGNLATQLGVKVRIQNDPAGGLIATVAVPATLIETTPPTGTGRDAGESAAVEPPGPAEPTPEDTPMPVPPSAPTGPTGRVSLAARLGSPTSSAPAATTEAGSTAGESETVRSDVLVAEGAPSRNGAGVPATLPAPDAGPPPGAAGPLPRRVPGAQRPDSTSSLALIRRGDAEEPAETGGSDLLGFLNGFGGGADEVGDTGAAEEDR